MPRWNHGGQPVLEEKRGNHDPQRIDDGCGSDDQGGARGAGCDVSAGGLFPKIHPGIISRRAIGRIGRKKHC